MNMLFDQLFYLQSLYLHFMGAWRWWCFYCCTCWWKYICIWKGKSHHVNQQNANSFSVAQVCSVISIFLSTFSRAKKVQGILLSQLSKIQLNFPLHMHDTVRYGSWCKFSMLYLQAFSLMESPCSNRQLLNLVHPFWSCRVCWFSSFHFWTSFFQVFLTLSNVFWIDMLLIITLFNLFVPCYVYIFRVIPLPGGIYAKVR